MIVEIASQSRSFQWKYPRRARHLIVEIGQLAKVLGNWMVGVELVSPSKMQSLNYKYRGQNKTTDILSFPLHGYSKANLLTVCPQPREPTPLGEIFICPDALPRIWAGTGFNLRLRRLLVHGILHCLGYDHQTESDYKQMYRQECFIMAHIAANSNYRNRKRLVTRTPVRGNI